MGPDRKIKLKHVLVVSVVAFAIIRTITADAHEKPTEQGSAVPCATLVSFTGDVRILDPSRTSSVEVAPKTGVPCGGWVSTVDGAAELKHRDGYRIRLAPQTFVELPETNPDGKFSVEPVVLYKGEVFAEAGSGTREMRILTANGRASVARGKILVVFDGLQESTQVVALDAPVALENRFEPTRRVRLRAGESSILDFKLLRVVPSAPKAVATTALLQRITPLALEDKEQSQILAVTRTRETRSMAVALVAEAGEPQIQPPSDAHGEGHDGDPGLAKRELASVPGKKKSSYARHQAKREDAMLTNHLVSKLAGDDPDTIRLLKQEKAEKRRLLNELSELSRAHAE